jgi:hypothetical protein
MDRSKSRSPPQAGLSYGGLKERLNSSVKWS